MQETKFIYFPLYLSDYVSEARKMTMLQRGAFVDLACLYFQENLKLSYTKTQIYRMVFAFDKAEQDAIDFILQNYFIQSEEEPMGLIWVSKTFDLIGARVSKRLEANRKNGKKGGRGNKKDSKPTGSDSLNPDESILNESKLNEIKLKELQDSQFESFWNLYDKKLSRTKAEEKFKKALKKDSFENIMNGLRNYVKTRSPDSQYWKYPDSWLHNECWKDEYKQTPQSVKEFNPSKWSKYGN